MQYLHVTSKCLAVVEPPLSFRIVGNNIFAVVCFLSKANRSPIQPYLLKNTTTSLCVAVQIRKKEHLPSPREITLTHEQLI